MRKIREIWPKEVPEYREKMAGWMGNNGSDGAASMLAYLISDIESLADKPEPTPTDMAIAMGHARRHAKSLLVADLFHITHHKLPEVTEAAEELPRNLHVQRHFFHSDHGVMVFERGYHAPYTTTTITNSTMSELPDSSPVLALSWCISGDVIRVITWADTWYSMSEAKKINETKKLTRHISDDELNRRIAAIGPLMMTGHMTLKVSRYMEYAYRIGAHARRSLLMLLSACLMLNQNTTSRRVMDFPRSSMRGFSHDRPDLGTRVTVIDKRRPESGRASEVETEPPKRQLSVRYDRRGHWRHYKSERFSPEVREHPIWVPRHWVGDKSLPVADRSTVTRLKR